MSRVTVCRLRAPFTLGLYLLTLVLYPAAPLAATDGAIPADRLYRQHCLRCHGENRLGGTGPALLPQNLRRLSPQAARKVIAQGRPATQMPAFADQLAPEQIAALADYVYSEPSRTPTWTRNDVEASRTVFTPTDALASAPVHDADPLNLFLIIEKGDHHATVLDGDRFVPLTRFQTHFAVHGGPKFSPNGRFVYIASRDGWITKYDLWGLTQVAEVRAGINTRNVAISGDGRFLMVGNYLPHNLVVLDAATLAPLSLIPVVDDHGESSRVSAVYTAPPRHSFIAALKDLPEVWEIPYGTAAEALPVYRGLMHDYRIESGESPPLDTRRFPVRRIKLDEPLDDFFFDPAYRHLIGAARGGTARVVNLTVGRAIAELPIGGFPHLGSGITWRHQGERVLATPNLRKPKVTVIDTANWKVKKEIPTKGPGFFMRSHSDSPYAWVDVFFGPNRDVIHVIDKESLAIVKDLRPAPGKTAAHVEFTRDGRYALVSIWEQDGAVVVYDAETLEEVKRLPMRKPSGKYNVFNKINYDSGTSH